MGRWARGVVSGQLAILSTPVNSAVRKAMGLRRGVRCVLAEKQCPGKEEQRCAWLEAEVITKLRGRGRVPLCGLVRHTSVSPACTPAAGQAGTPPPCKHPGRPACTPAAANILCLTIYHVLDDGPYPTPPHLLRCTAWLARQGPSAPALLNTQSPCPFTSRSPAPSFLPPNPSFPPLPPSPQLLDVPPSHLQPCAAQAHPPMLTMQARFCQTP